MTTNYAAKFIQDEVHKRHYFLFTESKDAKSEIGPSCIDCITDNLVKNINRLLADK